MRSAAVPSQNARPTFHPRVVRCFAKMHTRVQSMPNARNHRLRLEIAPRPCILNMVFGSKSLRYESLEPWGLRFGPSRQVLQTRIELRRLTRRPLPTTKSRHRPPAPCTKNGFHGKAPLDQGLRSLRKAHSTLYSPYPLASKKPKSCI